MASVISGDTGTPPYVGSRPFVLADAVRFHGRVREAARVAALWREHRLTVLSGGSGAGLTSLVQAGAVPRARGGAVEVLPVARISLGTVFPLAALPEHNPHTIALLGSWSPEESLTGLTQFTVTEFLRKRWQDRRTADSRGRFPLLLCAIDQAEELLTGQVADGQFVESFIAQLAEALALIPQLRLLLCVRLDYRAELAARLAAAGCAVGAEFELGPLHLSGALEAVCRPLDGSGLSFGPGVAEGIVEHLADGGGEVASALLQAVCARLWRALPAGLDEVGDLDLRRLGGVRRLLADHCDQAVAAVAADHGLPAAELWSWLRRWSVTDLGARAQVEEEPAAVLGIPLSVVRALRDKHILSVEQRAGSRWYALQHGCLLDTVREAAGRQQVRDLVAPEGADRSPADYLSAAKAAMAGGDLALAGRHAAQALRESHGRDLRLSANAEAVLGNVAYVRGDPAEAEVRYRAAAALAETLRDTATVGYCLAAIGKTLLLRRQRRKAVDCLYGAVTRVPGDAAVRRELQDALS